MYPEAEQASRTRSLSGPQSLLGPEAGGPTMAGNREWPGPGPSPGSGGRPAAAGFLMDKAHRTERLSLSSGKGHPGRCPAGGGRPCITHQAPSLPRGFIFTSVKCKITTPSCSTWKFTGGLHWSADIWQRRWGPPPEHPCARPGQFLRRAHPNPPQTPHLLQLP